MRGSSSAIVDLQLLSARQVLQSLLSHKNSDFLKPIHFCSGKRRLNSMPCLKSESSSARGHLPWERQYPELHTSLWLLQHHKDVIILLSKFFNGFIKHIKQPAKHEQLRGAQMKRSKDLTKSQEQKTSETLSKLALQPARSARFSLPTLPFCCSAHGIF